MKMKQIAIAIAFAFTSGVAIAADTQQRRDVSDGSPKGNTAATEYWTKHSKDGYMTRDQAMGYKAADKKAMDWKRLNTDADDRVSEAEWTAYHSQGATRSDGSKGADERSGASGRTGRNVDSGVSTGGAGGAGANPSQPKDSDPTSSGRGSN